MSIDGDGTTTTAAPQRAEIRETHSGVVILLGERAYKIKKPVDLGFLDFRTEQSRREACRRELELNRRLAPDVYLDVASIAGSGGTIYEDVLVMHRMPEALRLSALIERGADVEGHLRAVARLMAGFHAGADRGPQIAAEMGATGLGRRWTDNLRETEAFCGSVLDADLHRRIQWLALRYVDGRGPLLAERAVAGMGVDGHGDLIAEDIFCLPDHPRVLDCLEFDDRLRWVDVLDDVAFLAMDLERLGRRDLAERFLRWYAEFSATPTVSSLQHHYIAYRAFVRVKVSCIRAAQGSPTSATEADDLARLALCHLEAGEVRLVLVGGGPGTGKTTLATALADELGWVLLSSDTVRRQQPNPGRDRYTAAAKAATYGELLGRARRMLEHGESVIADATWGEAELRRAAAEVAASTASRLVAFECRAPIDVAAARAEQRHDIGGDASEADAGVARFLSANRDPWPEAIAVDTALPARESLDRAMSAVAAS